MSTASSIALQRWPGRSRTTRSQYLHPVTLFPGSRRMERGIEQRRDELQFVGLEEAVAFEDAQIELAALDQYCRLAPSCFTTRSIFIIVEPIVIRALRHNYKKPSRGMPA